MSSGSVTIDRFPDAVDRYDRSNSIVVVDVIRATTTAVTALETGRRCFPVATVERAFEIGSTLEDPLYAGELRGVMPEGFELQNSPSLLAERRDVERPLVLISTAGTELLWRAREHERTYAACLRNHSAQAKRLLADGGPVVVIGAGGRGEFRIEDRIGCALIAADLIAGGFEPLDGADRFAEEWSKVPLEEIEKGTSAKYLQESGQDADLRFVLERIDDVPHTYHLAGDELVRSE